MPPKPFPFQLNVGTDICLISRVRAIIEKPEASNRLATFRRYLRQFMSTREQFVLFDKFDHVDLLARANYNPLATYLAGRWAAKEATVKAFPHRKMSFRHVQILTKPHIGGVYALVLDKPASALWQTPRSLLSGKITDDQDGPPISAVRGFMAFPTMIEEYRKEHPSVGGSVKSDAGAPQERDSYEALLNEDVYIPWYMQDDDLPGQIAKVSISHDGDYATAVCLAAEEPMPGDVGGEAAAREP